MLLRTCLIYAVEPAAYAVFLIIKKTFSFLISREGQREKPNARSDRAHSFPIRKLQASDWVIVRRLESTMASQNVQFLLEKMDSCIFSQLF